MDHVSALHALLVEQGERLAKRWVTIATSEAGGRAGAPPRELRKVLRTRLDELERLLATRGADAAALWGEAVRHHGGWLFENGFTPADLVRQFHALTDAIAEAWTRRHGAPPDAALLAFVGEVTASGAAAAADDYLRRVRTGRTRVRDEGAIESIVRHLDEGLLAFESDGTLSFATPQAAHILGVSPEDLIGLGPDEQLELARRLGIAGDDPLGVRQALKTRAPSRGLWRRLTRPADGEERIVELSALPIVEGEELRGVTGTIADRTDEFRQRQALEDAYEQLRRLHVRQMRRSRVEAAGELAARIGLTIQNALNGARLRCRLLAEAGAPVHHLEAIERSIDEVAQVVASLQELGGPRAEGEAQVVSLDALVGDAVELVRPELAGGAGPRLVLDVDLASGAMVRARRAEVRELAVHLLLAALDGAPDGAAVRLATERHGDRARLLLDAPVALAEAEGLAPVRELAASWGGEVRVEGTRTIVELPAVDERPTHTPARAAAAAAPAHRVLVVDDDDDSRKVLAEVLALQGFEVAQAASVAEARAQARTRVFEAALVDVVMPDGSGFEVVRLLRALHPDARIALVTGAGAAVASEPGAGVDVVFAKPVDLDALLGFLGRAPRDSVPAHGPGSG